MAYWCLSLWQCYYPSQAVESKRGLDHVKNFNFAQQSTETKKHIKKSVYFI